MQVLFHWFIWMNRCSDLGHAILAALDAAPELGLQLCHGNVNVIGIWSWALLQLEPSLPGHRLRSTGAVQTHRRVRVQHFAGGGRVAPPDLHLPEAELLQHAVQQGIQGAEVDSRLLRNPEGDVQQIKQGDVLLRHVCFGFVCLLTGTRPLLKLKLTLARVLNYILANDFRL